MAQCEFGFDWMLSSVPARERSVLRHFNYQNDKERPPSVKLLANMLGFEVEMRPLPWAVSGFLEEDTWAAKGWTIVVNDKHDVRKRRFTVLHEIAHYYLGHVKAGELDVGTFRALGDTFDKIYSDEGQLQEKEANRWAAALLFGANAMSGALGLYGSDTKRIAHHFGCSESAVNIAMKRLRQRH